MGRLLAFAYGLVCYVIFFATFLYAVGFVGGFVVPKGIDDGRPESFVTALVIVIQWIDHGFGALGQNKLAILAFELLIVGLQIFFSSFLLSIIGLRRRDDY